MAVAARLMVEINGNSSGFEKMLGSASKGLNDFGAKAKQIGGGMTAAITLPVIGAFGGMITAASDLAEAQSAVSAVYGDSAGVIIEASENAARSVGMSSEQYLSAAKLMGVYADAAGLTGEAMSDFGTDTLSAAADLASFHNVPMDEALAAIASGLSGETEPLKKFGILMNEASLNEYAWANGIAVRGEALTEQQKVLARQGFIMENLGAAQGDFERTSGGLANQLRIMKAELTNVAAEMGTVLLPYVLKGVKAFGTLIERLKALSPRARTFILIFAAIAAAIGPILLIVGHLSVALSLLLGPIGLIVLAIAGLAIAWKKNMFGIQDRTKQFIKVIAGLGKTVGQAVRSFKFLREVGISPVRAAMMILAEKFPAFRKGFTQIGKAIESVVAGFRMIFRGDYLKGLGRIFGGLPLLIGGILKNIKTGIGPIDSTLRNLGGILEAAGRAIRKLFKGDFEGALDSLKTILPRLRAIGETILNAIVDGISAINWGGVWDTVKSGLQAGWDALVAGGLILADIGSALYTWMRDQISGVDWSGVWDKTVEFGEILYDGILEAAGEIKKAAEDFGAWLKPRLIGTWNGQVNIGIVEILVTGFTISATAIGSIPLQLIQAINSLDTSGVGEALGRKLAENPLALFAAGVVLANKLVEGFVSGITSIPAAVLLAPLIVTLPIALGAAAVVFVALAVKKGAEFMVGFAKGLTDGWTLGPLPFLIALPGAIVTAIGDVTVTLFQKGVDLVVGLWNGILSVWATLAPWITSLPGLAVTALGDVTATLYSQGMDLLFGLDDGIWDAWESVVSPDLHSIAGNVAAAVGDLSGTLYWAGRAVMSGLWQGLIDGWGEITNWLGTLNPANYKGPAARDKKMLLGTGELIMGGLSVGLASGWQDVTKQLSNYVPNLSGAVSVSAATTAPRLAPSPSVDGAGGRGYGDVHVHLNVEGNVTSEDDLLRTFTRQLTPALADMWVQTRTARGMAT
jgi:hypothetical protein